jgi:hypothetical protein
MLERQHLVCSLGATVVMTDPAQDFIDEDGRYVASSNTGGVREARNSFGDAVRFILSGTTCLKGPTGT